MLIIFGQRQYGKKNLVSDRMDGTRCGGQNCLVTSYSTWEAFHVWYIPIIPYASYRVVYMCPACQTSYKFPLGKPQHISAIEDLKRGAIARLGANIDDTLEDVAALAHLGGFEAAEALIDALAARDEAGHALADGLYHSVRGKGPQAEACYRRALQADRASGRPEFWLGRFLLKVQRDAEAICFPRQAAQATKAYEYLGILRGYRRTREWDKNWAGLEVIMSEMLRLEPRLGEQPDFAKAYEKACRKTGRMTNADNPYAQS